MSERFFRFECEGAGIYEAVDKHCPRDDDRRGSKPDGSWVPKAGTDFPGAKSFWTQKGLKRYEESGLRDWHLSVVAGETRMNIVERPSEVLYEDEWQIVASPDQVDIRRSYLIDYCGPRPFKKAEDERPRFIRHHNTVRDWCTYSSYPQSEEMFSYYAGLGAKLGLERVAVNHEVLQPGRRSSWPHAHKIEEEMVYVLKGKPQMWIHGKLYEAKPGDLFYYPAAKGHAHTVVNNTDEDVEVMVLGEQNAEPDWIIYPMHPEREQECKDKGWYWDDPPPLAMGTNSGAPGDLSDVATERFEHSVNIADMEPENMGGPDNDLQVFYKDRDLSRKLSSPKLAFHHVTLVNGYRSSLPHAESQEEEFVYVLKGNPIAWVNGKRFPLKEGESVAFPAGTGIAHTFLNESGHDVDLLVIGERTKDNNLCSFPVNPEEKEFCKIWWDDPPPQEIGPDSPIPGGK